MSLQELTEKVGHLDAEIEELYKAVRVFKNISYSGDDKYSIDKVSR